MKLPSSLALLALLAATGPRERVEATLNSKGLSFQDLTTFKRVGYFKDGRLDPHLKYMFGNDAERPKDETHCLCVASSSMKHEQHVFHICHVFNIIDLYDKRNHCVFSCVFSSLRSEPRSCIHTKILL